MTPSVTTPSEICASDDSFNDTLCDDSPVLDLQTRTRTHIRRLHLQRHPVTVPNDTLSRCPTTPCVTARSSICEPGPLHTQDDTSNDTLCDSPPPPNESTKSANPHPPTWSKNPYSFKAIWGKTCSGSTKDCPKVIGCPTFGRQGYISTRNSEPAHCHHIYRILLIYRIYLRKKTPKIPAFRARIAVPLVQICDSTEELFEITTQKLEDQSLTRSWMKATRKKKNFRVCDHIKNSTCNFLIGPTTGKAKREKQNGKASFQKTQNLFDPTTSLKKGSSVQASKKMQIARMTKHVPIATRILRFGWWRPRHPRRFVAEVNDTWMTSTVS